MTMITKEVDCRFPTEADEAIHPEVEAVFQSYIDTGYFLYNVVCWPAPMNNTTLPSFAQEIEVDLALGAAHIFDEAKQKYGADEVVALQAPFWLAHSRYFAYKSDIIALLYNPTKYEQEMLRQAADSARSTQLTP